MQKIEHNVRKLAPLVPREAQAVWTDASVGFRRRSVSPPAQALSGEALECELDAGVRITYDASPRAGLPLEPSPGSACSTRQWSSMFSLRDSQ